MGTYFSLPRFVSIRIPQKTLDDAARALAAKKERDVNFVNKETQDALEEWAAQKEFVELLKLGNGMLCQDDLAPRLKEKIIEKLTSNIEELEQLEVRVVSLLKFEPETSADLKKNILNLADQLSTVHHGDKKKLLEDNDWRAHAFVYYTVQPQMEAVQSQLKKTKDPSATSVLLNNLNGYTQTMDTEYNAMQQRAKKLYEVVMPGRTAKKLVMAEMAS